MRHLRDLTALPLLVAFSVSLALPPSALALRPRTDFSGLEEALSGKSHPPGKAATDLEEPHHPFFVAIKDRQAKVRRYAVLAKQEGKDLGFTPEELDRLADPKEIFQREVQWRLDDGTTRQVKVVRVKDTYSKGKQPGKGGIRALLRPRALGEAFPDFWNEYVRRHRPSQEEARRFLETQAVQVARVLAKLMSWKIAMVELDEDLGGAKGDFFALDVVPKGEGLEIVPFKDSYSRDELDRLSFAVGQLLAKGGVVGPDVDVPAPDMATDSRTMGLMTEANLRVQVEDRGSSLWKEHPRLAQELKRLLGKLPEELPLLRAAVDYVQRTGKPVRQLAAYTGKPVDLGGSLGRSDATALGGLILTERAVRKIHPDRRKKRRPLEGLTVAVHGFGNAGKASARLFAQAGAIVKAVSDTSGYLYKERGFTPKDLRILAKFKRRGGRFKDYQSLGLARVQFAPDHLKLLELDVEILVLSAIELAITEENAPRIKARLTVPEANGAVTSEASALLAEQGKIVLPDGLASAGGVIVSWFEMLQNFQARRWTLREVEQELRVRLTQSFESLWREWEQLKRDLDPEIDLFTAGDIRSIRRLVIQFVRVPTPIPQVPTKPEAPFPLVPAEAAPVAAAPSAATFWQARVGQILGDPSLLTEDQKVAALVGGWRTLHQSVQPGPAHEAADQAFVTAIPEDRLALRVFLELSSSPDHWALAADYLAHLIALPQVEHPTQLPLELLLGFWGAGNPDQIEQGLSDRKRVEFVIPWDWLSDLSPGRDPEEILRQAMEDAGYVQFEIVREPGRDIRLAFVPRRLTSTAPRPGPGAAPPAAGGTGQAGLEVGQPGVRPTAAGLEEPPRVVWVGDVEPKLGDLAERVVFAGKPGQGGQRIFVTVRLSEPLAFFKELDGKELLEQLPGDYLEASDVPEEVRKGIRAQIYAAISVKAVIDRGQGEDPLEVRMRPVNVYEGGGSFRFEGETPHWLVGKYPFQIRFSVDQERSWKSLEFPEEIGRIHVLAEDPAQKLAEPQLHHQEAGIADRKLERSEAHKPEGALTARDLSRGRRARITRNRLSQGGFDLGDVVLALVAEQYDAGVIPKDLFDRLQFKEVPGIPFGPALVILNTRRTQRPQWGQVRNPLSAYEVITVTEVDPVTKEAITRELPLRFVPIEVAGQNLDMRVNVWPILPGALVFAAAQVEMEPDGTLKPPLPWDKWPGMMDVLVELGDFLAKKGYIHFVNKGDLAAMTVKVNAHSQAIPFSAPIDTVPDEQVDWFVTLSDGLKVGLLKDDRLAHFVVQGRDRASLKRWNRRVEETLERQASRFNEEGLRHLNTWFVALEEGEGRTFIVPRSQMFPVAREELVLTNGSGERLVIPKGRLVLNVGFGTMEVRRRIVVTGPNLFEDPFLKERIHASYGLIGYPKDHPAIQEVVNQLKAAGLEEAKAQAGPILLTPNAAGLAEVLTENGVPVAQMLWRDQEAGFRLTGLEEVPIVWLGERPFTVAEQQDRLGAIVPHAARELGTGTVGRTRFDLSLGSGFQEIVFTPQSLGQLLMDLAGLEEYSLPRAFEEVAYNTQTLGSNL